MGSYSMNIEERMLIVDALDDLGRIDGICSQYFVSAFFGSCAQRKIAGGAERVTIAESAMSGVLAPRT